jgi:hypothetical protein
LVELSRGTIREIALHRLPWLTTVDGCELTLRSAAGDRGVLPAARGKGLSFECALTPRSWETVAALTEPFCQSVTHGQYQWLDETSSISLLLTPDGRW